MQIPDMGAYGLQAWLVSVTLAAMGLTKAAVWIKHSGSRNGNGTNGRALLAREAGKFEGQVLELTKRVIIMTEAMHQQQRIDRETWAPMLRNLVEGQTRMMNVLDLHANRLEQHSEKDQQMWQEMLAEFGRMVDKVGNLPCTQEEDEES
jgi:hypothetical protein